MSTDTASNTFACPFCGGKNAVSVQALQKVQLKCSFCKLPLKNQHHAKFAHLDPTMYRHPLETDSWQSLQVLPGIQNILQKVHQFADQSFCEAFFASNSLRVSEQQYPELFFKLQAASKTLGLRRVPHLYVSHIDLSDAMGVYAYSGGIEHPFVVLSSRLLALDDTDILVALSHELGHIHAGHLNYKVAADFLPLLLSKVYKKTPLESFADSISLPIQQALITWRLKANLTADRSAMLVLQDENLLMSYLMRQAGGLTTSKANLEAFRAQAEALNPQIVYTWLDKYWQQILFNRTNMNFPVWRATELHLWSRENQKGYGFAEIVKIFGS